MKIQIIKFESVDSTNNVALRRIKKGKIKPTLIIAKSQKKGRGQYGSCLLYTSDAADE